jgi:tripartite-type tricarboxylate transporter receptor subunit TctC
VPTLAELGVPAANLTSLFGFMAPAGTPPEIVARLNQEVQRALAAADVQHTLRSTDNVALHHSPQEFAALLQQESRNNAAIIRQAHIQL